MATTRTFPEDRSSAIEMRVNEENGTVTFVNRHDGSETCPPTEWLTVTADAVVDTNEYR